MEKVYLLRMACERIGEGQQIIAVYTSAKAADRNKAAYQRSQKQLLDQRDMYLTMIECALNKEFN